MLIASKLTALNTKQITYLLTCCAAIIAALILYNQHGWINDDSVLYFEAARLISIGKWKASWTLYNWPLYPMLIAGLNKITALSFQTCAQILSVLFFSLATHSYLSIITLSDGKKIELLIGALLLFSTQYIVGDILAMLLRDQGFWACMLTALVFLIKFHRSNRLYHALGWQIFALLATLFRVEAIIYLILLPFTTFFPSINSSLNKVQSYLKLQVLNLVLFLILFGTVISSDLSVNHLGRINEIWTSLTALKSNIDISFTSKTEHLAHSVLGAFLDEYAWVSLLVIYILIATLKSITVAGWLPMLLIITQRKKLLSALPSDAQSVLLATAALTYIVAIFIIFQVNLLSSRYVIALGFVCLIYATFATSKIYHQWRLQPTRTVKIILILTALVVSAGLIKNLLPHTSGYHYELEAVAFLKQQNISNEQIFFVSPRARYYAGAEYAGRGYDYWNYIQQAIRDGKINQFRYLMLPLNDKELFTSQEEVIRQKLTKFNVIATFYSESKNKKVIILESSDSSQLH